MGLTQGTRGSSPSSRSTHQRGQGQSEYKFIHGKSPDNLCEINQMFYLLEFEDYQILSRK
jgi:hypothetical protein